MKIIDKENNIAKDMCPLCGKDGATIQTTEFADGEYIEVMCLNGCGHFSTIIKRESELIDEQVDNEEWIKNMDTEQLAEWICSVHEKCYYCGAKRVSDREHCPFGDGKCRNNKHEIAMWLKQPHREE